MAPEWPVECGAVSGLVSLDGSRLAAGGAVGIWCRVTSGKRSLPFVC